MANESPDMMASFSKAAGVTLMACGICLLGGSLFNAISAGSAAGLGSSLWASAFGTGAGYAAYKGPEWASSPA